MEAPRLERKLVAILAADVEGYSRHMEQNEVATLASPLPPSAYGRRFDCPSFRPDYRDGRR